MAGETHKVTEDRSRPPKGFRKVILDAGVGNFAEWYDFAIYGYLATALAAHFFPSENETASLLATLATFAVAFVMRPVGAAVFGVVGDRIGRRTTLATVILLMSGSTFLIGLLPSYATIGIWAPVLLVIARCLQGVSAGGEYGGATTLVAEYAPARRRAFYLSFLTVSTVSAFIAAALMVALMSAVLPDDAYEAWGWRVPFLLALPIGVIGLYIRLRLEDTPSYRAVERAGKVEEAPLRETIRIHWRRILLLAGFIASNALGFYFLATYIPTYLKVTIGMSATAASVTNAIALVVVAVSVVLYGRLADRIGRKPIVLAACALFFVLAVPSVALVAIGTVLAAIVGQALFGVAQGASQASTAAMMTESFPTRVRYTAASVSYNLAYMVFGGTAPLVGTALTDATGSALPAGVYVSVVAILAFVCGRKLRETMHLPMVRESDIQPEAAEVGDRTERGAPQAVR